MVAAVVADIILFMVAAVDAGIMLFMVDDVTAGTTTLRVRISAAATRRHARTVGDHVRWRGPPFPGHDVTMANFKTQTL